MARRSLCLATRSLALAALLTSCSAPAPAPPAGTSAARPAGTVPIAPTPTTSTAITPTSAPVAAVPADQRSTYDQARLALVEGDLTDATNRLRGLQSASLPPEAAREVRYELAIALSGQGSGVDALNVLATPGAIPDDREAFARGLALEVADRHAEAMQSLAEFATANPTVAAAVWLEVAERELNARRPREAADAAGHGLDTASPVSEKQRLLEVRAQALAALGDNQAAFDAHRQVLTLATSDATLGEQLFRLAQVSRDLGQHDAAIQALQTALDRFPQASTTPDALRLLDELGAANEIDAYVLGRARYSAVDYRNAVAAFDAYLQANPDGPDAPSARLYRSLASLTPGNEPNALRELDAIADDPSQDSELAAQALVEAGQVLDGLAEPDQAEQRYAKLLDKFPRLDAAATASFRLGLDRYIRGADADAVAAWDTLVARRDDLGPDDVSRALYWRARAFQRLGRDSDARTSLQQAAAVRPAGYYALRAQAQLEPAGTVAPGGPSSQSDADQPELEQFFAARNLNLDSAFQTVAADPALQRAQAEARLGLFREANWEADDLLQRYPDRPDRLYALARDFTDLDLFGGATRLGQAAYAATGVQTPTEAPRALLQAAYPRPFANLTDAAGERYGLDPLLLESTLRDATQFDAWSDDAATGARGLAAMSPIHAEEASLALHAASGRSRAQAVPSPPSAADAIENQAWLLADRLRRYAGRPEAALGAIATTERLAEGWLARAGSDDPEVMLESIDYEPVRAQLRDVFATELTYGIAYAGPGSAPAPGDPLHPMLPKPEPTAAWIKIARLAGDVPDPAPLSAEDIGNPDAPDAFQRGTSLARDGNFADAISTFQSAGSNPDPTQAAAAQLRLGQALLGAGRTTEAVSSLQAVDAQQPDQIAAFLLGKAFEALNRCDDAGAALDRFASANPGRLAAQARLAEATCLQSVGRPADAVPLLEQAAQAQDLPRLQQLDFRERLALARLRSGDSDGAIADYSGLLSEARTSSYRSELNYDLGVIAADPSTAVAHFRQAVQLDPKARAARAALDELVARQDSSATSLDAADTRFEQSRYLEALADYSTDQSTARAVYGRGVSLVRLAQDRRGIGVLESMATEFPDTSGAADGLFRAGRIRESLADLDGAANDYGTVIGIPNAGSRANDARFRLAFVQFEQGDVSAAANGWRDLAGRQSAASDRAQADFWLGKALHAAGAEQEAQTAWSAAASADPHRFYGLRAGDELNGQTDPRASADTSLQALQSHAGDDPLAPILAWAQSQPDGASALQRVQSDPAFVSADSLLAMGLRQPAIWQFEAVEARFSSDPAAMAVLGGLELRRGLYNTALSLGYDLASTAHLSPTAGPDALRRLIYPLPDPGVLAASAKEIHTDPLLFAALMHQESNMDETAESAAQARGLSQLTASTAYDAARALGVYAFTSADLYTPTTSIRLGAFTFAQRLNRYDQQIFPALAAYNAGPFSVDGWLLASGKADIDTFVEAVPFTETYPYVQAIYENYRQYLELYGSP